jgi:hypothetical protein
MLQNYTCWLTINIYWSHLWLSPTFGVPPPLYCIWGCTSVMLIRGQHNVDIIHQLKKPILVGVPDWNTDISILVHSALIGYLEVRSAELGIKEDGEAANKLLNTITYQTLRFQSVYWKRSAIVTCYTDSVFCTKIRGTGSSRWWCMNSLIPSV